MGRARPDARGLVRGICLLAVTFGGLGVGPKGIAVAALNRVVSILDFTTLYCS